MRLHYCSAQTERPTNQGSCGEFCQDGGGSDGSTDGRTDVFFSHRCQNVKRRLQRYTGRTNGMKGFLQMLQRSLQPATS